MSPARVRQCFGCRRRQAPVGKRGGLSDPGTERLPVPPPAASPPEPPRRSSAPADAAARLLSGRCRPPVNRRPRRRSSSPPRPPRRGSNWAPTDNCRTGCRTARPPADPRSPSAREIESAVADRRAVLQYHAVRDPAVVLEPQQGHSERRRQGRSAPPDLESLHRTRSAVAARRTTATRSGCGRLCRPTIETTTRANAGCTGRSLNMLHRTSPTGSVAGLTGPRQATMPPNDAHLEQQLSTLLSGD